MRIADFRPAWSETAEYSIMTCTIEAICADLEIVLVPCNVGGGPMRTKAGNVLHRLLERHGEGHLILVLRTIVETKGNDPMLIEPVIHAVSDLFLAHPAWGERGLRRLEAFDDIDLKAMAAAAKANREALPARRQAMGR